MLHPKDIVIATHDIAADGRIVQKGTRGMVLKLFGFDKPSYRVEFSFGNYPRTVAVVDALTDLDLVKVQTAGKVSPTR